MTTHVPKEYDFSVTKDVGLADMPEDLTKEVSDVFKKANFSQSQVKTALALYSDQLAKLQDQKEDPTFHYEFDAGFIKELINRQQKIT